MSACIFPSPERAGSLSSATVTPEGCAWHWLSLGLGPSCSDILTSWSQLSSARQPPGRPRWPPPLCCPTSLICSLSLLDCPSLSLWIHWLVHPALCPGGRPSAGAPSGVYTRKRHRQESRGWKESEVARAHFKVPRGFQEPWPPRTSSGLE